MTAFDDRLITVTVEIEGKKFTFDQNLNIRASGEKYGVGILGVGQIQVDNIEKSTRDYLLTKTSLYSAGAKTMPAPAVLTLEVGRKSYGTFRVFTGQVIAGQPSQPPDIGLTFRSMTGAGLLGLPVSFSAGQATSLFDIALQTAQNMGLTLSFQAKDKTINNYTYNGAAAKQIQRLQEAGNVDVFIDGDTLVVKDSGTARTGPVPLLTKKSGMVGVPQLTERGVIVKTLMNSQVQIGGAVAIQSTVNPAANGTWANIFRLGFEVASREPPFYWTIEANNSPFGFAA